VSVTGMFGRYGHIELWVDRGYVVNGNWTVWYHEVTDEVSYTKEEIRAQRICDVVLSTDYKDYNQVIAEHQDMIDGWGG
jgi:hypothetical protein